MLEETGCDGVMVGRGALGNPWIFCPEGQDAIPSLEERKGTIGRHLLLLQNYYGEKKAVREIRKHLYWHTKGLPFNACFHSNLSDLKEKEALLEAIRSYFDSIERRSSCHLSESEKSRSATG
jgi:tRNA-dihydrouridine synthase